MDNDDGAAAPSRGRRSTRRPRPDPLADDIRNGPIVWAIGWALDRLGALVTPSPLPFHATRQLAIRLKARPSQDEPSTLSGHWLQAICPFDGGWLALNPILGVAVCLVHQGCHFSGSLREIAAAMGFPLVTDPMPDFAGRVN